MPTYAYRCSKCGDELEVMQSMSDPALTRCKKCRGKLNRVFHPVGIVLKGSGFYKTDNARPRGSRNNSREGTDQKSDSSDKQSEKKSDSSDKQSEKKPESSGSTSSKAD